MDFRKKGKGELINFRVESLTDTRTGELVTYYRVDLVGEVDPGVPECFQVTCGSRALNGVDFSKVNRGTRVEFDLMPREKGGAKLVSLRLSAAAAKAA